MLEANETELVSQFTDVTGANSERARFYLEASQWDVQVAIASFFEGDQSDQEDQSHSTPPPPLPLASGATDLTQLNRNPPVQPNPPVPQNIAATSTPGWVRPTGGVGRAGPATLDSLRQQEESSDDDDKGEAFFAGGSITSGQQVLGPPKKKDDFIKDLFEKAREHGATVEEQVAPSKIPSSFGGTGYKLGDTASGATSSSRSVESEEPQEVTLRLWSTGFTIDNGEIRLYSDANNLEFLNSIKRGEVPRELVRNHQGHEVQLAMEDRRHESYVPPKVAANPFIGKGHMLGSPAPTIVSSVTQLRQSDRSNNEDTARSQINLIQTEPTTNIQFRLADGTRLVARFNHSHRVSDLHSFINTARPEFMSTTYTLTLFPNRDLTDMEATIKDANVLNSALIQKMKSTG